jgi:hypothetical protein
LPSLFGISSVFFIFLSSFLVLQPHHETALSHWATTTKSLVGILVGKIGLRQINLYHGFTGLSGKFMIESYFTVIGETSDHPAVSKVIVYSFLL